MLVHCDWTRALLNLERFLKMGLPYYDTNFCPSLLIDFLWHAFMLDGHDVKLGIIIPHCSTARTAEEDQKRYQYFCKVYTHWYGEGPYIPSSTGYDAQEQLLIVSTEINKTIDVLKEADAQLLKVLSQPKTDKEVFTVPLEHYNLYKSAFEKTGLKGNELLQYVLRQAGSYGGLGTGSSAHSTC
jgi:hypothetical protein